MPDQAVILLAEDREDDILLIRKAFKAGFITNPVFVVRDGEETIAYFEGVGKFSNRAEYPLPDLLLLDLKMPKIDGFEVLKWLRRQPGLVGLPVVVLTSSENMRDVRTAYQLGANSFIVKPMEFENVIELSKNLRNYWLRSNITPPSFRDLPKKSDQVPRTNPDLPEGRMKRSYGSTD